MQRLILALVFLTIALGSYWYYFLSIDLPKRVNENFNAFFENAGFANVSYEDADIRIAAARFKHVSLDSERLSTIGRMEITYTPFLRNIKTVKIYDLNLIGDYYNNRLSIAGWNTASALESFTQQNFRSILFKNAKVALLTDNLGGINIQFDAQARRNATQIIIDGRVETIQKNLSLVSNLTGLLNADLSWQGNFDIEGGKFNLNKLRAMRLSGKASLTGNSNQPLKIESEFQAGGFNIDGTPWQNASGSFNGNLITHSIFLNMQSVGTQDRIELGLHINKGRDLTVNGIIHAENSAAMKRYSATHENSFLDTITIDEAETKSPLALEFMLEPKIIFSD